MAMYEDGEFYAGMVLEYDDNNNLIKTTLDNGNIYVSEFKYDAKGNVTQHTEYANGVIECDNKYDIRYDSDGNMIRGAECTGYRQFTEDIDIPEEFTLCEFEYDPDGNITKKTLLNENGKVITYYEYEYDSDGNLRKEAASSGDPEAQEDGSYVFQFRDTVISSAHNSPDYLEFHYQCEYDSSGNILKTTGQDSVTNYTNEYDANGNLLKQTEVSTRNGGTPHIEKCYEYEYDAKGNVITERFTRYLQTNTTTTIDHYEYDESNNLIKIISFDEEDPDASVQYVMEYDEYGNQIKFSYYEEDGNLSYYVEYEYIKK